MCSCGANTSSETQRCCTDLLQADLDLRPYVWLHTTSAGLCCRCRRFKTDVSDRLLSPIRFHTCLRLGKDQYTVNSLPWLRWDCHLLLLAIRGEHHHQYLPTRQEQEHCVCLDGRRPAYWIQRGSGTWWCVRRNYRMALGVPYFCHHQQCCLCYGPIWIAESTRQERERVVSHQERH